MLEAIPGWSDGQLRAQLQQAESGASVVNPAGPKADGGVGGQPGSMLGSLSDVLLGQAPIVSPSPSVNGLVGAAKASALYLRTPGLIPTAFHVYLLALAAVQALQTKFERLWVSFPVLRPALQFVVCSHGHL